MYSRYSWYKIIPLSSGASRSLSRLPLLVFCLDGSGHVTQLFALMAMFDGSRWIYIRDFDVLISKVDVWKRDRLQHWIVIQQTYAPEIIRLQYLGNIQRLKISCPVSRWFVGANLAERWIRSFNRAAWYGNHYRTRTQILLINSKILYGKL